MIYFGEVSNIHLNDEGLPLVAVMDMANNTYYPCSFLSNFGGFDGRFSYPSIAVGSQVVIAAQTTDSYVRAYYILGFLPNDDDAAAIGVDGVETALDNEASEGLTSRVDPDVLESREEYVRNEDYVSTHIEDAHIEVQDSFMNLSLPHGLTLQGDPRVSVQIPAEENACFRVSAGEEANNGVLNAVPHLDRIFDYIGTLQKKIDTLEAAVNAMAPGVVVALEAAATAADLLVSGSGTPIRQQSTDATNALGEAAALGPLVPATTIREDSNQDVNSYVIIP